jgi:hypothetical protein
MNSISRYCHDWNPELVPRKGRIAVYSLGVIVASTSHACTSCSMIRETRASILNAGGRSSARMASRAARSSCSASFIHSSLVWCWTMNSNSFGSGDSGCCALRIASRAR